MVGFELCGGGGNVKTSRHGCRREVRTFGKEKDREQRHKNRRGKNQE